MIPPPPAGRLGTVPIAPARRGVLRGAALAGLVGTVPGLVGRSGDDAATGSPGTASPEASAAIDATADSPASSPAAAGGISTSAVAPGQAILVEVAGTPVILAQPVAGTFKAYDSRCTHKGCQVAPASGLALACPCHGSRFDATDGSVTNGPAATSLTERTVTVEGDHLIIG